MPPVKFGVGQPLRRKEDDSLLRGEGRYVADFTPSGTLHAVVVRSPHAHARFRITDPATASALPGVRLILTGDDVKDLGTMPCLGIPPGVSVEAPPYPMLARGEARHVGDMVAFVVAETLDQAKDAAEAIAIEWEALPHVVDMKAAVAPGAPQVWSSQPGNVSFEATIGDERKTEQAFGDAARIVTLELVNPRVVTNYLDTRGVVAEYDAAADRLTLILSSQGPHAIRDVLCDAVLNLPKEKMRVVTPGGRRGVRDQAVSVPGIRARGGGGATARATGEMDRRAQRAFSRRLPGPRQRHGRAARAGREGKDPGARRRHHRRHGRVSFALRAVHPVHRRRVAARRLRHPDLPPAHARRVYPYTAGRCLSRCRPTGGSLRDRAAARRGGARARHGPGCAAQAQLHQAERDALYHRIGEGLRFRRVRRPHGARAGARRLGQLQAPRRCRQESRQALRHRPCDLHRGLRRQRAGERDGAARARRRRHHRHRHVVERAGAPHRLRANRRRTSRPAAGAGTRGPG